MLAVFTWRIASFLAEEAGEVLIGMESYLLCYLRYGKFTSFQELLSFFDAAGMQEVKEGLSGLFSHMVAQGIGMYLELAANILAGVYPAEIVLNEGDDGIFVPLSQ